MTSSTTNETAASSPDDNAAGTRISSEKGNVLIIGNSGVGKSTLVNAVLGEDRAEASFGSEGTTKELKLYESEHLPFRVIDTVGFEPSFMKRTAAIRAIRRWSKTSAQQGKMDTRINVIWFCVDGTSGKLFEQTIKSLSLATKMWPSVPVITVITKSYSVPDRKNNIEMVTNVFSAQRQAKNLRKIIPVVASTFTINENAYAAPEGITELIDATNELLPEGYRAAEKDIFRFVLNRKRVFGQGIIATATASGVAVGAVPIKFPDAAILMPVELAEVNALARLYGIDKMENSQPSLDSIVDVGTVSSTAKSMLSLLKAIPGVNIGAAVLNAVIAGGMVAAIGEGTMYAFEQVYLGNKSIDDLDWLQQLMESRLSSAFIDKLKAAASQATEGMSASRIMKLVLSMFAPSKTAK